MPGVASTLQPWRRPWWSWTRPARAVLQICATGRRIRRALEWLNRRTALLIILARGRTWTTKRRVWARRLAQRARSKQGGGSSEAAGRRCRHAMFQILFRKKSTVPVSLRRPTARCTVLAHSCMWPTGRRARDQMPGVANTLQPWRRPWWSRTRPACAVLQICATGRRIRRASLEWLNRRPDAMPTPSLLLLCQLRRRCCSLGHVWSACRHQVPPRAPHQVRTQAPGR